MKPVIVGMSLTMAAVLLFAQGADAQRRRGQRGARKAAPHSGAIAPALGDLRWGMSNREVFQHFQRKLKARYDKDLAKATDAIQEDRVRHEFREATQRIRRSYVRFHGQTTGWDVSHLRDEFTHRNGEAMMVVRDKNSQNFYFFINGRLWKWYKAFDASVFEGQTFDQFAQALQHRFGRALQRKGRLTERGQERRWLEWQDRKTRLRAIDQTRFYGFYCLVFEDRETLGSLDTLRRNRQDRGRGGHALVEAVTSDESTASEANQDIVDRITGRIRRRADAPESADKGQGASSSSMTSPSSTGRARGPQDDDPFRDMDL